jgi:hypothetical protein
MPKSNHNELFGSLETILNRFIKNNSLIKNGWGARIRTQEWRDQNPLPYRLATPHQIQLMNPRLKNKNSKHIFKHTITRLIPVLVLSFFLSSRGICQDSPGEDYLLSEKIISQNQGSSIETARFYKNGIIYSSQERLFFNKDQINYINAQDETIKNIIVKGNDFFIASGYGVYQNYRRIFSKGPCYHIDFGEKSIVVSCIGGLYKANFDPKSSLQSFNWQLEPLSPSQVYFFTFNQGKSNYEYAIGENGFFYFNNRKKIWTSANNNLKRDLNNSFGFGRFCVINKSQSPTGSQLIILGASSGIFISSNKGQNWQKTNTGLKPNPNGVFEIREIKNIGNNIFAVTSTGIYKLSIKNNLSKLIWKKLEIKTSSRDENNNQNFFSLDINKHNELIASNSQGEIFMIHTKAFPIEVSEINSAGPTKPTEQKAETQSERASDSDPINSANNINQAKTNQISKILKLEPNIQELQIAALEFSGIPDGKSFKKYRRQARLRNFLPKFETGANVDTNDYMSIEKNSGDSFNSNTSSMTTSFDQINETRNDTQNTGSIKLAWELGNIIYDPEINNLITSARLSANIKENLLTEITQIYYARKEAVLELLQEVFQELDIIPIDNLKKILKINEYTAQLDARSDGWFSQRLKTNILKANLDDIPSLAQEQIKEIFYAE